MNRCINTEERERKREREREIDKELEPIDVKLMSKSLLASTEISVYMITHRRRAAVLPGLAVMYAGAW